MSYHLMTKDAGKLTMFSDYHGVCGVLAKYRNRYLIGK